MNPVKIPGRRVRIERAEAIEMAGIRA